MNSHYLILCLVMAVCTIVINNTLHSIGAALRRIDYTLEVMAGMDKDDDDDGDKDEDTKQ